MSDGCHAKEGHRVVGGTLVHVYRFVGLQPLAISFSLSAIRKLSIIVSLWNLSYV